MKILSDKRIFGISAKLGGLDYKKVFECLRKILIMQMTEIFFNESGSESTELFAGTEDQVRELGKSGGT